MDSASILRGTSFVSLWYSLVLRCLRLLQCFEICGNMKLPRYTNRKYLRRQISCFPHGSHNAVGSPSHSGRHGEHFRQTCKHCSEHLNIYYMIICGGKIFEPNFHLCKKFDNLCAIAYNMNIFSLQFYCQRPILCHSGVHAEKKLSAVSSSFELPLKNKS